MFHQIICRVSSCQKASLSCIDSNGELCSGEYCLDHIPNPQNAQDTIREYIQTHDKIVGLNACGVSFSNLDFSGKRFYGCNFQRCSFLNIQAVNFISRMSVFDGSIFSDCNLQKSRIQFCSFGNCTVSHTLFTGSDLIQDNFTGVRVFQSSFDDSDLYNSCFVKADLKNTSFRNCNIKNTVFWYISQENVSFKLSNTKEAEFDPSGSEMFVTGGF